jgi:hypothetical protein
MIVMIMILKSCMYTYIKIPFYFCIINNRAFFVFIILICSNKLSNIYDIKGRLAVLFIKKNKYQINLNRPKRDSKIERLESSMGG